MTRIIDTHIHYGTDQHVADHTCVPYLRRGDAASVVRYLDEQGASHGVLWSHDRHFTPPWDADYHEANREVGEAVKAAPDRIIGVARINPTFGAEHTRQRVKEYVDDWGCRGLKLVAGFDFYRPNDLRVMGPLLDLALEHNLVLDFHSGNAPRDLPSLQAEIARQAPEVQFVLAHAGMHEYLWEAILAVRAHDNIAVEMSQMLSHDVRTLIREVGADRVMYGSDAPYSPSTVELAKCRAAGLDDEALDMVLYANAARIWLR